MVTAPLMALLFDRTFVTGSFAEAWRRRAKYYAALGATWIPLGWLVWGAGTRGGSVGFGATGAGWNYAWSQFSVITHYLALAAWPHPQLVDYGPALVTGGGPALAAVLLIVALAAGTVYLLWARPLLGFLGAWFFVILAPSSSIIPITTEIAAEHRMYLSLAALAVLAALGLARCAGPRGFAVATVALALALGSLTFERNRDYRTELDNYRLVVANAPENDRAHSNLAVDLAAAGRWAESGQEYENALRINPLRADVEHNLGVVLVELGYPDKAILHYRNALRLNPDYIPEHTALANLLVSTGRLTDAITEFAVVARLQPDSAEAHLNLGNALAQAQNFSAAAAEFSTVLKIKPDYVAAHSNLAFCLVRLQRYDEAVHEYEAALQLDPANTIVGQALAQARQLQAGAVTAPAP
jgi:tetratricopeptide (TPR) repeat protein